MFVTTITVIPFSLAALAMSMVTALRPDTECMMITSPSFAGRESRITCPYPERRSISLLMVMGDTSSIIPGTRTGLTVTIPPVL